MRLISTLLVCLALTGCGQLERTTALWSGWSRLCVDGVSYLQFTSGASVEYRPDGSIKTCEGAR